MHVILSCNITIVCVITLLSRVEGQLALSSSSGGSEAALIPSIVDLHIGADNSPTPRPIDIILDLCKMATHI